MSVCEEEKETTPSIAVEAERVEVPESASGFTHRQILIALSGLLLAVFLAALDQMIIATAMRTIADKLHGQTIQAWVTTAYLIASTISIPFYGKLSDIFGRKPVYLAAITVFIGGSLLCGFAQSMVMLALFRIIQGLGGGGLMSLPTAIVADLAPARERGKYFAYLQVAWVAASIIGPLVGGLFADTNTLLGTDGWRWAFLINVPLGIFALVTVRKALNLPHKKTQHRIDYAGAAAMALCLIPLLIVAERGVAWGWLSPYAIAMYVLSAAAFGAFLRIEARMNDEAMIPLRLFRRRSIRLCAMVNFTIGVGIFGTVATLPLFLQLVQGRSPTQAGLVVIPLMVGAICSQIVCGKLLSASGRFKRQAIVGLGSMAGAVLAFSTATIHTPFWALLAFALWLGVGIGLSQTVITIAMQHAAPKADLGVANATSGLCRQLGGSMGIALFISVLFGEALARILGAVRGGSGDTALHQTLADPTVTSNPANHKFLELVKAGGGKHFDLNDTSFLHNLDPRLAQPVLDGFASGFHWMFLAGGMILSIGFVLTWFMAELREES